MENKNYTLLYNKEDKEILKTAEDALNPQIDRVQEIIAYAKQAGMKKIGIANCVSLQKETNRLEAILNDNGFEVSKVHCKIGKVKFNDLVDGYKGISCNPAGQADYLDDEKTQMNIVMGLCVGHDMIFNAKSKAPVTPLIVKDRQLKHRTVEILQQ